MVDVFDAVWAAIGAFWRSILTLILFAGAVAIIALVTGCATRTVVKPIPVEVTKYVKQPIPANLVKPCRYPAIVPACSRNGIPELCNDQLLTERNGYRLELSLCDADKTELRKLGESQ